MAMLRYATWMPRQHIHRAAYLWAWMLCWLAIVQANVEKVIVLGPPALTLPPERPNFDDLRLHSLSPTSSAIRTHLPASFPSDELLHGLESWYLLRNLTEGQRYEVRVCWAATVGIVILFTSPGLLCEALL